MTSPRVPQDRDRPGWLPRQTDRPHPFPSTYLFRTTGGASSRTPVRRPSVSSDERLDLDREPVVQRGRRRHISNLLALAR
jgi:hypothetical protein